MTAAIIGGTGIDEMEAFRSRQPISVSTRYGSVDVIEGEHGGERLFFLPRHGMEHIVPPGQINYRAQIAALKKLEVKRVIGVCAVGSLQSDLLPGSFAVLRDFIDLTKHRKDTFFDTTGDPVVHTDFTHPYCPEISDVLAQYCANASASYEPNAVYVGVEGPRYESPAEIRLYASWGAHVIGMTNLPEAVLAREAGLCYGALGIVTNLATGISSTPLAHDDVRHAVASASAALTGILFEAIKNIAKPNNCTCQLNTGLIV